MDEQPATADDRLAVAFESTAMLEARPTGVGAFAGAVARRLAVRPDVDLGLFALTWRGRDRLAGAAPDGATVHARPAPARPLRRLWRRADRPVIEWWTGPADVVHGPNFVVPPTRRAAAVVTVHDLTCVRFPQLCTADTLEYPELIRRAVRRGAWIHAVSPAVAEEVLATFPVRPERVVAIDNGAPDAAPGDASAGRRAAGAERYVLALGTIEPRKDLPLLVRAFDAIAADHADLRLVVAGPDGWGVEAFDAACSSAAHGGRIVRLGWVDDATRADLLAGAAVFAFPSVYEGFGLPPLEAMAAGTPVVATDVGALPHTVGDGGLLVPTGDADALAGALAAVLADEELADDLRRRGTANLARFSWDRTVDDLVGLYRRAGS